MQLIAHLYPSVVITMIRVYHSLIPCGLSGSTTGIECTAAMRLNEMKGYSRMLND
jgi:hypothetical protein